MNSFDHDDMARYELHYYYIKKRLIYEKFIILVGTSVL